MSKVIDVRINFTVNNTSANEKLKTTFATAQAVRQILMRTLALVRRMGLPEDLEKAATVMIRVGNIAQQLQAFILMANTAFASTPAGAILLALTGLSIVLDASDLMSGI